MSKTPHNTIMWEFNPPHGVSFQAWQTSFRVMFRGDRLQEMLDWLDFQVQVIKQTMAEGKFYNEQPRAPQMRPPQSRAGKPRPEAVHGNHSSMQRRREPRRGTDDEADENSPAPKARPVAQSRGNVQKLAGDAPMQALSPNMAKPIPGKPVKPAPVAPTRLAGETKEQKIKRLERELIEAHKSEEVEYEEVTVTDVAPEAEQSQPEPQQEAQEQQVEPAQEQEQAPDLTGPRIYRHRWPGAYAIGEVCMKCGTECTGTEELCPVP
jgi:hypothetical protein